MDQQWRLSITAAQISRNPWGTISFVKRSSALFQWCNICILKKPWNPLGYWRNKCHAVLILRSIIVYTPCLHDNIVHSGRRHIVLFHPLFVGPTVRMAAAYHILFWGEKKDYSHFSPPKPRPFIPARPHSPASSSDSLELELELLLLLLLLDDSLLLLDDSSSESIPFSRL